MKKLLLIVLGLMILVSFKPESPSPFSPKQLIGAWESTMNDQNGKELIGKAIITDGYISVAFFYKEDNAFYGTAGGSWTLEGDMMSVTTEFNTQDIEKVGTTDSQKITIKGNTLVGEKDNMEWTRIDNGKPGKLEGAWLMTGRKRDGEISRRTPGERKTMKILSGTRFQWIAFHTGNGGFFGTGGGTYTTQNGKYTENIEFFSRDVTRVGMSLEFDFEIKDGEWHHSGKSSKGDPMYEIWGNRKDL